MFIYERKLSWMGTSIESFVLNVSKDLFKSSAASDIAIVARFYH